MPVDLFFNQPDDFAGLRVAVGIELGVYQFIVQFDFKPSPIRGDQGDGLNFWFKLVQEFLCQAHGSVGVMSDHAIGDRDLYHFSSPQGV